MKKEKLIGQKFNRLTVISAGRDPNTWVCKCSCGNNKTVTNSIQHGIPKSCGCLNDETRSQLGLNKRKYHPRISSAKFIYNKTYNDGDIGLDDFFKLSQQNCFYCGIEPFTTYNAAKGDNRSEYAINEGNFIYNGLDRLDSSKPHNLNNVVTCCKICNRIKSDMNIDDFKKWVNKIYNNWASK